MTSAHANGTTPWPAIAVSALVLTWCAGCPQMAITTAATTAASALVDDRSLAQQGSDLDLKAHIEQQLLADAPAVASRVNVDVYRGRVMLTGVVGKRSQRRTALAAARTVAGDHEIYDDIEVAPGGGLADAAGDFAVNKELGVKLLADEGIASQSFQHRVVDGTAYILGQAKSESQVETARQVALQTSGVQRVVTHIVVEP
jgi:osmotically-inducible protein OsmY